MIILAAAAFVSLQGGMVISEIMYNPDGVTMGPDDLMEWVELCNIGEETLSLGGMMLSDGNSQLFLDDYLIQPGDYAVVAANPSAFSNLYSPLVPLVPWQGSWIKLRNSGDTIALHDSDGELIETVAFTDGWGGTDGAGSPADGDGSSLERIDLTGGSEEYNWTPSEDWDYRIITSGRPLCWGTPGERNSCSR